VASKNSVKSKPILKKNGLFCLEFKKVKIVPIMISYSK
jgi:hypothetical protein